MWEYVLYVLGIMFSIFLLMVLFTFICGLFVKDKFYSKNSKFYRFLLYFWTGFMVVNLRIKIHVEGLENVPKNSRFLLVGNHRSNYDPILTWHILKKYEVSFISKKSNFKIPFFGKIIRKCSFMEIDRENPRNAIKTINAASELIVNNEVSVAVYPEGTRSKTKELLPFHNGVFKIAQKSSVPIVVLTIQGTENIYKNIPFKKTDVQMKFVSVISEEEVNSMSTSEIGEKVKTILLDNLKE